MAKKSTVKCTATTPPARYVYDIGFICGDTVLNEKITGTCCCSDVNDELEVYDCLDGQEVKIAAFKDWKFYRLVAVEKIQPAEK